MSNPTLQQIMASLPADQQAVLASAIRQGTGSVVPYVDPGPTGQRSKTWNNYYSIIRWQAQVSVASPTTTLTFVPGELRAFSYRINDPLTGAGFDATFGNATDAETNLVTSGQTIAGEQLKVNGIAIMPSSVTDIGLWKQLLANVSVVISMDGDAQRYRLGRVDMIPGSGGTFGTGITPTVVPNLDSSSFVDGSFSNGWPVIDNYYPFPEPLIWTPSGETDSNFNVVLRLVRQQVISETARTAATGVAAYTPPTAVGQFGTFVDMMVRLHTDQTFARSVNR